MERIELTREQALTMLKHLSIIEGFLLGVPHSSNILDIFDYSVNLLTTKLE